MKATSTLFSLSTRQVNLFHPPSTTPLKPPPVYGYFLNSTFPTLMIYMTMKSPFISSIQVLRI